LTQTEGQQLHFSVGHKRSISYSHCLWLNNLFTIFTKVLPSHQMAVLHVLMYSRDLVLYGLACASVFFYVNNPSFRDFDMKQRKERNFGMSFQRKFFFFCFKKKFVQSTIVPLSCICRLTYLNFETCTHFNVWMHAKTHTQTQICRCITVLYVNISL
jgi:hypothetical protein